MAPKIWAFVAFEAISLISFTELRCPTSTTNVSQDPRKIQIEISEYRSEKILCCDVFSDMTN
jgi:hypothetical protein